MVEDVLISVLVCGANDFCIICANQSSLTALKELAHVLPVKADQMAGQCIDILLKDSAHQRRLLSDPKNLPHKAKVTIGREWLDLYVTAL